MHQSPAPPCFTSTATKFHFAVSRTDTFGVHHIQNWTRPTCRCVGRASLIRHHHQVSHQMSQKLTLTVAPPSLPRCSHLKSKLGSDNGLSKACDEMIHWLSGAARGWNLQHEDAKCDLDEYKYKTDSFNAAGSFSLQIGANAR